MILSFKKMLLHIFSDEFSYVSVHEIGVSNLQQHIHTREVFTILLF